MRHVVGVLFTHRADFAFNAVGDDLFGVSPAHAGLKVSAELRLFFVGSEGVENLRERRGIRILGFARQLAVGDDAADGILQRLGAAFKKRDDVVVALTHLAAVQPRQHRNVLFDLLVGHAEEVFAAAVEVIKARRDVARHLKVLNLILADGNAVGVEHQNVGRHQNGVAVKAHRYAGVHVFALGGVGFDKRFVGVCAVHEALGADAVQEPIQLRNFRNVALTVKRDVLGIEPCSEPTGRNLHAA